MTALAIIGLVVGLVVLLVVIKLLNETLAPLRAILADLQSAKTAGMLEHGVRGAEQLSTTRSLASSVPDLALRYLNKLGASGPARSYTIVTVLMSSSSMRVAPERARPRQGPPDRTARAPPGCRTASAKAQACTTARAQRPRAC
jgi:hypothetical protein